MHAIPLVLLTWIHIFVRAFMSDGANIVRKHANKQTCHTQCALSSMKLPWLIFTTSQRGNMIVMAINSYVDCFLFCPKMHYNSLHAQCVCTCCVWSMMLAWSREQWMDTSWIHCPIPPFSQTAAYAKSSFEYCSFTMHRFLVGQPQIRNMPLAQLFCSAHSFAVCIWNIDKSCPKWHSS